MKTLFVNSRIWLGKNSFADSLGFDSVTGKISFSGNFYESSMVRKEYDEIIDLKQKLVLPAFTDGHCHFIQGSFVNSQLNLRNAKTKNEFINGIREYQLKHNKEWIFGGFFSESNFKEPLTINRQFLDEIYPDIPIIISKFDMHSAFANTKALEKAGLLNNENNFTSDEIIRDDNTSVTGELKERARDFILRCIPPATLEEKSTIATGQISKFHSYGITSISDITLPEDLGIYKDLIKRNKLLLNVDARLPFAEFENINECRKEFSHLTKLIKFGSLKAFYDGSLSSRTALMHSDYKNSDYQGIRTEFVNSGEFKRVAFEIEKAGIQMSVHAIGDKAVTELLDLNEEIISQYGLRDRRFRIEHAQHICEKDFQRFKELNVIASVQPSHLFSDAMTAFEILDDYKLEHNYKKLFDIGAKVCLGTDFPVVSENPFETIYYAMTRKAPGFDDGFIPQNKISLTDCLEAYTINNAFASICENEQGSLQTGKNADIIVLETDLFKLKSDEIKDVKVSQTYFRGEEVFCRD